MDNTDGDEIEEKTQIDVNGEQSTIDDNNGNNNTIINSNNDSNDNNNEYNSNRSNGENSGNLMDEEKSEFHQQKVLDIEDVTTQKEDKNENNENSPNPKVRRKRIDKKEVTEEDQEELEDLTFMAISPQEKAAWIKMLKSRHATLAKKEQEHKKWQEGMTTRKLQVFHRSKKLLHAQRDRFRFLFKMAEIVKQTSENKHADGNGIDTTNDITSVTDNINQTIGDSSTPTTTEQVFNSDGNSNNGSDQRTNSYNVDDIRISNLNDMKPTEEESVDNDISDKVNTNDIPHIEVTPTVN